MLRKKSFTRWLTLAGLGVLILTFASCQGGCGANSNQQSVQLSTPQIISRAQLAIQHVTSYHFDLATDHLGTLKGSNTVVITKADGDIQVPDKLQAQADVTTSLFTGSTNIVVVGNQQYIMFPLTEQWMQASGLPDPHIITDSRLGIAGVLANIQQPSAPTDNRVNGLPCWQITGKLDPRYLSSLMGLGTQPGHTVNTTVCIDKNDYLTYSIILQGVAIDGDTPQTTRTFTLSNFNEPVTITKPKVS